MSANADESFRDEIVIHIVHGIPYQQHLIFCNPGRWPEIRAELGEPQGWLEIRHGGGLVVVGTLTPAGVDRPGDVLARGNPLRAATDDAGLA
jgi:hypothetical protein